MQPIEDSINTDNNKTILNVSEIKQNELKPITQSVLTKPKIISDKVLSHIQADFYIAGAPGQEGNVPIHSVEMMLHYLHKLPQNLTPPEITQLIQEFDLYHANMQKENEIVKNHENATEKIVKNMQSHIKTLKDGERYFFPGGWLVKLPGIGHAMVHAIEKQPNGKYALLTFNTG